MKTIRDNNESSESTGIETALATGPMPAAAETGEARMAAGTTETRRPGRAHGLRGLVVCAGLVALLAPLPALAAAGTGSSDSADDTLSDYTKDQVVYVKADAEGDTQGIYVVNAVDSAEDGTITETGDYQGVQNLTDTRPVTSERGEVTYDVDEDETFYYRGDLSVTTGLPWDVEVRYYLDDDEVDPEEVAGAEGDLRIVLSVGPSKHAEDSAELSTYTDNYLLQITAALDDDEASSIVAPDATMATAGNDTQLTYMVMPGEGGQFEISAQVKDFSFDGFTIVGIPLSMSIDVDTAEMVDGNADIDKLTSSISDVNDGAQDVSSGAADVSSGSGEVRDGASALADGLDGLVSSSSALVDGSASVAAGLSSANDGAASLSSAISDQLVPGMETLATGSGTYRDSLASKAQESRDAADAVDVATAQATYEQAMQDYVAAYVQCVLYGGDPASDETVTAAQGTLQQALTDFVTAQATVAGYDSAADALDQAASGYADIDAGIQGLVDEESDSSVYSLRDGASELADGVSTLSSGYGEVDQGISDYTAGAASLQDGARTLSDGATSLADGASTLASGAKDLADGTQQMADETSDLSTRIADTISDEIDSYLHPEFTMVDFVNGESSNVGTVQFVIMTESIEAPDDASASNDAGSSSSPDADNAQQEQTFWDKLMALFE